MTLEMFGHYCQLKQLEDDCNACSTSSPTSQNGKKQAHSDASYTVKKDLLVQPKKLPGFLTILDLFNLKLLIK